MILPFSIILNKLDSLAQKVPTSTEEILQSITLTGLLKYRDLFRTGFGWRLGRSDLASILAGWLRLEAQFTGRESVDY
jgi:hypothetical protein